MQQPPSPLRLAVLASFLFTAPSASASALASDRGARNDSDRRAISIPRRMQGDPNNNNKGGDKAERQRLRKKKQAQRERKRDRRIEMNKRERLNKRKRSRWRRRQRLKNQLEAWEPGPPEIYGEEQIMYDSVLSEMGPLCGDGKGGIGELSQEQIEQLTDGLRGYYDDEAGCYEEGSDEVFDSIVIMDFTPGEECSSGSDGGNNETGFGLDWDDIPDIPTIVEGGLRRLQRERDDVDARQDGDKDRKKKRKDVRKKLGGTAGARLRMVRKFRCRSCRPRGGGGGVNAGKNDELVPDNRKLLPRQLDEAKWLLRQQKQSCPADLVSTLNSNGLSPPVETAVSSVPTLLDCSLSSSQCASPLLGECCSAPGCTCPAHLQEKVTCPYVEYNADPRRGEFEFRAEGVRVPGLCLDGDDGTTTMSDELREMVAYDLLWFGNSELAKAGCGELTARSEEGRTLGYTSVEVTGYEESELCKKLRSKEEGIITNEEEGEVEELILDVIVRGTCTEEACLNVYAKNDDDDS